MKRDYRLYLRDILAAMRSIDQFVAGLDYDGFADDEKSSSAVVWKLQIIGEASKNIPQHLRRRHPDIPWKEMAGMRDRIAHSYFGIDLEIVWKVVKKRLPEIQTRVETMLSELDQESLL